MAWERTWLTATRLAIWIAVACLAVLLASGLALAFRYQPTVTSAYANVGTGGTSGVTARGVHRLASTLFVGTTLVLLIASVGLFVARRKPVRIVLPVGALALALLAGVTGYALPWDQLSLAAVKVGTEMRGYGPILRGDNVRFVLIGGSTSSTAMFARWFWVHAALVPLAIVGVVAALSLATRRARSPQSPRPASS